MRVLLVDPSDRGGLVAYTSMVTRGLKLAGASVSTLGSRSLTEHEAGLLARLPVSPWGRGSAGRLAFYRKRITSWTVGAGHVLRAVYELEPDVVHFQAPLNRRLDAKLIALTSRRAAVVWTAHDVLPFEDTPRDRARFRRIYQAADGVIVHSPLAADELATLAGVQGSIVAHPVPEPSHAAPREVARRELGLPTGGRILGAVGFVRAYKGYDLLADVWEHLGERAPTLLVVGEVLADSEEPTIERLRASMRTIVRTGYAPDRELELAVAASDALVLPYARASDSGVLHLGRALGTPVLASDAPQLAASVCSTGSGVVLERTCEAWSQAVLGRLPPAPPPPPSPVAVGEAHLAAYASALRTWSTST